MVAMIRAAAVIVGLVGAVWAGFVMLYGPIISNPPPEGGYLLAVLGFPVLMLLAGFVVAVSLRGGLAVGLLALTCVAVVLRPYSGDESLSDFASFAWWVAWAPVILVVLAVAGLVARARSE